MKEIKFRVHCGDTGKILAYEHFNTILNWGYYWTDPSELESEAICHAPAEYFKHPNDLRRLNRVLYTGLKDKNGTDGYESDVFTDYSICDDYGSTTKALIGLSGGAFRITKTNCDCGCLNAVIDDLSEFEILGNIYESPELMPQGDKCP